MRLLKLAASGGIVASVGVLAFYAFVIFITLPGRYSGLDIVQASVTWIAVGLIVLLVIGVNIVYARVLFAMSRFPHAFPISGEFPRA